MPRRVKCQDSGEYSTSDIAYKAPNGKYYTTADAYERIESDKIARQSCISAFIEATDWKQYWSQPTVFFQQLPVWAEAYGYAAIHKTILAEKDSIAWAIEHKDFKNAYGIQKYVNAIIANNLQEHAELLRDARKKEIRQDIISVNRDNNINQSLIKVQRKSTDVTNLLGDI